MITKLDHLALTARDFTSDDRRLRRMGYEQTFHNPDIPNPPNKRDLMGDWTDTHTLAMYEGGPSVPIELIDYRHTVSSISRFIPVHPTLTSNIDSVIDEGIVDSLDSNLDSSDHHVPTIGVMTRDLSVSVEFWSALGLTQTDDDRFSLDPPFGDGFELLLCPSEDSPETTFLDADGFPCIAFVTSSIHDELSNLEQRGYHTTSIHTINFPERTLDVAFVIGPAGEPVEFVSPTGA